MISDDLLYDGEKTITHCLLPVLRKDCDEFYMNEDNFIAFRERLDYNLPFIFDMVQQKDDVLFNCVGDTKQVFHRFSVFLTVCMSSSFASLTDSRQLCSTAMRTNITVRHVYYQEVQEAGEGVVRSTF